MTSIEQFLNKIICGDAVSVLKTMPDNSVDCVITSPPYWKLRDYGVKGQIGLEKTITEYLAKLLAVFAEIQRVLKPHGTCFVNLGDTYGSSRTGSSSDGFQKSLLQIPSRFALGMVEGGWILRNEIIWHKPNCLPESVKDRFTADYQKIFFFVQQKEYYFARQFEPLKSDISLKKERVVPPGPARKYHYADGFVSKWHHKNTAANLARVLKRGRNKRCVWTIPNRPFYGLHFATFPPELVETPIKAGCPEGGVVLDPFMGSGTTALVAKSLGRHYVGIELNRTYVQMAKRRLKDASFKPATVQLAKAVAT